MSLGSCLLIEKNVDQGHLKKLRQIYKALQRVGLREGPRFCTPNVGLSFFYGLGTGSCWG